MRVSRQTIYDWINEPRVERLICAPALSRLRGGDRKSLLGMMLKKFRPPASNLAPKARSRKLSPDSPGR